MHHLEFEKIIDKIGSKYEAVVRMAVKARKIAEDEPLEGTSSRKITLTALNQYLQDLNGAAKPDSESKK